MIINEWCAIYLQDEHNVKSNFVPCFKLLFYLSGSLKKDLITIRTCSLHIRHVL